MNHQRSDAIVLFGASGDLAKKMTFISLYRLAERGLLNLPVIGVAFSAWDDETLRAHAKQAIQDSGTTLDEAVWDAMAARMRFVQGDYTKPETYTNVKSMLASINSTRPLFYLEIPPGLFEVTVKGLHDAGLTTNARVVVEKPFGHDLTSAQAR
jgi:glucose-6-phosphate 1-dehydrogenase